MKLWRIGWYKGDPIIGPPVEVEADPRGYPHNDADGIQQCGNTHFETEAQAWEELREHARKCVETHQKLADYHRNEFESWTRSVGEYSAIRDRIEADFAARSNANA